MKHIFNTSGTKVCERAAAIVTINLDVSMSKISLGF